MRTDELMNIRNNQINGNKRDVYSAIKDYGLANFPIDYLNYLESIWFTEEIIIEELRVILYQIKYYFNRSI